MSAFNELFSREIEDKLYDNNAFLVNMKNVSEFLNGRVVHIPNFTTDMGAGIMVNGSTYSFAATETVETDLTFNIDSYRVPPFKVTGFDEIHTNYNKFQLLTQNSIASLTDRVAKTILYKLAGQVNAVRKIATSGATGVLNSANRASNYKKLNYTDILKLGSMFDEDNLPQDGRFLLLDAEMYKETLEDEAIRKAQDFGKATLPTGVVAQVGGINIMKRAFVAHSTSGGVVALVTDALQDTDERVAYAWSSSVIVTAKSDVVVRTNIDDPNHFGSIVSTEMFLGCTNPRTDLIGGYIIYQG